MSIRAKNVDPARREQLIAELHRDVAARQQGFRERALRLLPHVCGRCGREFSGQRLKELTVHHRDHDHNNNPPDGSNWELLCIYCHDHEHEKLTMEGHGTATRPDDRGPAPSIFKPFDGLDALLKGKEENGKKGTAEKDKKIIR